MGSDGQVGSSGATHIFLYFLMSLRYTAGVFVKAYPGETSDSLPAAPYEVRVHQNSYRTR